MIISRTPFRLSFLGGGTDFPWWFKDHGGSIIGTTIDKYCYLTCRYLPPFFEHRIRVVYSKIELCKTANEVMHPAVAAILKRLKIDDGVEIHHDGDLPARSGIGSSSSFVVGLLHALLTLQGSSAAPSDLAGEAIVIERDILNETVGCQDQILVAHGGLNRIVFSKDGSHSVTPIEIAQSRREELNDHLMLFYTGFQRSSSAIAATYSQPTTERIACMTEMAALVDEGLKILTSRQSLNEFGKLLHTSWRIKRSMSDSVSRPEIDEMYATALRAGAIGGKITGAGGGGFLMLFVPPEKQAAVREALRRILFIPFRFEQRGSQIILCDREQKYTSPQP